MAQSAQSWNGEELWKMDIFCHFVALRWALENARHFEWVFSHEIISKNTFVVLRETFIPSFQRKRRKISEFPKLIVKSRFNIKMFFYVTKTLFNWLFLGNRLVVVLDLQTQPSGQSFLHFSQVWHESIVENSFKRANRSKVSSFVHSCICCEILT